MNNHLIEDALVQYETPLYIFDIDQLRETVDAFRTITGRKIGLCFAMKANPFLVKPMAAWVDRIEVCSPGEFEICRTQKIPTNKMLISGVLKKKTDIFQILDHYNGHCLVSVESPQQFATLGTWSNEHQQSVDVLLRLSSGNQFGMDEQTIHQLIESREQWPFLNIRGLHYFSGTQKRVEKTLDELDHLDHFLSSYKEQFGFHFEMLEFGPGLAVPLFQGKNNETMEDMQKICHAIGCMKWQGTVTLEMGRAFTAPCGTYLTRVLDTKTTNDTNYAIVDGGMHHLQYDGQIRGMFQPNFKVLSPNHSRSSQTWCICGALCTTNDILLQKCKHTLSINDVLAFESAGAYTMTEGMSLFLSHPLPTICLYCQEQGWQMIRKKTPTYFWNMSQEEKTWNN